MATNGLRSDKEMADEPADLSGRIGTQAIDNLWSQCVADPGDLSLGKLAGGVDATLAQFVTWRETILNFPYLPVADTAH